MADKSPYLLCAYIIAYTLSILGNSLVCYMILKYPNIRNTTNLLLCSLAVTDLLSSISGSIVLLFQYKAIEHPTGFSGDVMCRALTSGTITYIAIQISEITLMVLAVDRYFSVCFPLASKFRIKRQHLKYVVATIWLVGVATYSQYIVVTRGDKGLPCYDDYPSEEAGIAIALVDFSMYCAIPLLIFIFCYSSIVIAIWRPKMTQTSEMNVERRKRQVKTTRILLTVTFFFCVCVVPLYISLLTEVISTNSFELSYTVYLFLLHLHATVNPFIYIFQSSQFRAAFRTLLRRHAVAPASENSTDNARQASSGRVRSIKTIEVQGASEQN